MTTPTPLTLTIPAEDVPAPGEIVSVTLDGGLVALIENTAEPIAEVDEPTEAETASFCRGGGSLAPAPDGCSSRSSARSPSSRPA